MTPELRQETWRIIRDSWVSAAKRVFIGLACLAVLGWFSMALYQWPGVTLVAATMGLIVLGVWDSWKDARDKAACNLERARKKKEG